MTTSDHDPTTDPVAPRTFTHGTLARLLEIASAVQCECPNHLARLVTNLLAFEDYSRDCENRTDDDARIHRMLYHRTAEARAVMEQALVELMEFEQIPMPE